MEKKKRRILIRLLLLGLSLGMFVGCGQKRMKEMGESNGEQKYDKEYVGAEVCSIAEASTDTDSTSSTQEKENSNDSGKNAEETQKQEVTAVEEEKTSVMIEEMEESLSQSADDSEEKDENSLTNEISEQRAYYLTEEDKTQVLTKLAAMGESYGLTYYPEITDSETWDSPTPIYEEELILGRDHVMNAMVEYSEGAFVLMQMEGCKGFALSIKEYPHTVTDAYYEVYVYWL